MHLNHLFESEKGQVSLHSGMVLLHFWKIRHPNFVVVLDCHDQAYYLSWLEVPYPLIRIFTAFSFH